MVNFNIPNLLEALLIVRQLEKSIRRELGDATARQAQSNEIFDLRRRLKSVQQEHAALLAHLDKLESAGLETFVESITTNRST